MKHTPGPWKIGSMGTHGRCEIEADNILLATILNYPNEQEANARLIAAAPELLELVKDYLSLLESEYTGTRRDLSGGEIAKVERAIAKAEGKGD